MVMKKLSKRLLEILIIICWICLFALTPTEEATYPTWVYYIPVFIFFLLIGLTYLGTKYLGLFDYEKSRRKT